MPSLLNYQFMSYSIDIDALNSLVIVKYWNIMSSAEFLDYIAEMEASGPFEAQYRFLMLLHPDLQLTVSTKAVRKAAQRMEVFSENAARVIVAPSSLAFGLGRLFSLESEHATDRYSIVRSVPEACQILGANETLLSLEFAFD
ncbi:MAG: hypothetical protein ACI9XU_002407 [Arenicella sp.]|jgi:hypothetical protein